MKNKLFSINVEEENRIDNNHNFCVSLEFCNPISEKNARDWLQRVIADAAAMDFEVPDN